MTNASSLLTMKERSHLEVLLHWNVDIFVWSHSDMLRIDVFVVAHKLNILQNMRSERQKVRSFHPNCQKVIQMVIDKLLLASFIWEVAYLDCLSNIVVVPKKRGTWRMCVDYTNLNDACPKDSFLLPRIDQIVYSPIFWTKTFFFCSITSFFCKMSDMIKFKKKWRIWINLYSMGISCISNVST